MCDCVCIYDSGCISIVCHWMNCGGGICKKKNLFMYGCECTEGYSNFMNIATLPCVKQCKKNQNLVLLIVNWNIYLIWVFWNMFWKVHLDWTAWILGSLRTHHRTHHRLLHLLCLIAARVKVWWLLPPLIFIEIAFFFNKILIFEQVDVCLHYSNRIEYKRIIVVVYNVFSLCLLSTVEVALYMITFILHVSLFVYGYCSVLFCISLFLLYFTHLFIFFS